MSQNEFEKRIAAIMKRLTLLKAVQAGDAKLRRIRVREYKVRSYHVPAHYRYIAEAEA